MKTSNRANRGGFSLIEVMIVALVLGIAAAVAVPKFGSSMKNHRASLAANQLAADLNYAAAEARATGMDVRVSFDATDESTNGHSAALNVAPEEIVFDIFGYPDRDATWVINENLASEQTISISKSSGRVQIHE